ncbi:MAG: VanW family protein [Chloroflexi bacterium]|nr:VanW family protein [Chloroflexota bacterium]
MSQRNRGYRSEVKPLDYRTRPLEEMHAHIPPPPAPSSSPRARHSRNPASAGLRFLLRFLAVVLLLAALTVGGAIGAMLYYQNQYDGRIYRGVSILGVDLSGLTPQEAMELLPSRIRSYDDVRINLHYGDKSWPASLRDLGAQLSEQDIVQVAYRIGRTSDWLENSRTQLVLMQRGVSVPIYTDYSAQTTQDYLASLARQIDRPAREATLALVGTNVQSTPSQVGLKMDVPATQARMADLIRDLKPGSVDIVVNQIQPQVTDVSAVESQLKIILGSPLRFGYAEKLWTVNPDTLAKWVTLKHDTTGYSVSVDQAKVQTYVETLASQVKQDVVSAQLRFDRNAKQVVVTSPSKEGRALDVTASTQKALEQIQSPYRDVGLVVSVKKPDLDSSNLAALGIKELIWEETSYFAGSAAGRAKNIQLAASKFNDVVIPPGGIFSFLDLVGEISPKTGYDETYIIADNQTVRGAGGGVCQVSTTVFRAAFWSGFPIIERYTHSYRVAFYEQGNKPVGLDATIYNPGLDFRFQNDSPAYLLIETKFNAANSSVTFSFFGTKPNRTVEMEGPTIQNVTKPGPATTEEDPTKPKGYREQTDIPRDGLDVTIYRVIKQGDTVIQKERFPTHFDPTVAHFIVGTKS